MALAAAVALLALSAALSWRAAMLTLGGALLLAGWCGVCSAARPDPGRLADAVDGTAAFFLDRPVWIEAVVLHATRAEPERLLTGLRLLRVRRAGEVRAATDVVRLSSARSGPWLLEGDRLRGWVVLRRWTGFANGPPAWWTGTGLTARLKSTQLLDGIEPGRWSVARGLGTTRRWLARRLDRGLQQGGATQPVRALAAAVTLGARHRLEARDQRRLRAGGLAHVLAISGLHMTALVGAAVGLLRRAGAGTRMAAAALMLGVPAYMLLLPVRPSVLRAGLMGLAPALARVAGRDSDPLNVLGGLALAFLATEPRLRMDPGFALSFTVTAAILHLAAARGGRAVRLLGASAAATAAAMPLTASFFGEAVPAALLANVAAVPLAAALVLFSGTATLAAALHPVVAAPLAVPIALLVQLLFATADTAAGLPGGRIAVPAGRPLLSVAALAALFAARRQSGGWRPVVAALAVLGQVAVLAGWGPPRPLPPRALSLRVVDVGQGEALLVGLPSGEAILVDGGGLAGSRLDIGHSVVIPALRAAGLRRLRAVVLTHAHHDHGAGLKAVLEEVGVDELWLPALLPGNTLVSALVERAVAAGVAVRVLERGDVLERGGVRIRCLAPPRGRRRAPANRHSLVLHAEAANGSLLLTGDLEDPDEVELIASGLLRPATVLKVAHHGSATSTRGAFLERVRPRRAVISAGRINPWGHPAAVLLERLQAAGIPWHSTHRDGAVTLVPRRDGVAVVCERPCQP